MDNFFLWTVYDHPRDLPGWFVVRRCRPTPSGQVEHELRAYCFHTLEKARAWLAQFGLVRTARAPEDDPVIVEVWL
jgi:hypothetical protein